MRRAARKPLVIAAIAGLLVPTSGQVQVMGQDVAVRPEQAKAQLGFLTGTTGLYARLTAREVLTFFGRAYGIPRQALPERITTVAERLRIRPLPGELQRVADILSKLPEIIECDRVTGEDCFVARAHVRSLEHLERQIDKVIPYAMTNTSIIQSSPVAPRLPVAANDPA